MSWDLISLQPLCLVSILQWGVQVVLLAVVSRRTSRSISTSIAFYQLHHYPQLRRQWVIYVRALNFPSSGTGVSTSYGKYCSWRWFQQEAKIGWDPTRCAWSLVTLDILLPTTRLVEVQSLRTSGNRHRSLYKGCPWGIRTSQKIFERV